MAHEIRVLASSAVSLYLLYWSFLKLSSLRFSSVCSGVDSPCFALTRQASIFSYISCYTSYRFTIRACCLLPVPWDGLSHCCFAEYFEVPAGFLTFLLRIINRPWLVVHCFVGNDLFLQLEVWRKDNCCLSLSETFETQSLTGTGKVDKT